jgi:hypothetical protein
VKSEEIFRTKYPIQSDKSTKDRDQFFRLADQMQRETERSKLPGTTGAERHILARKRKQLLSGISDRITTGTLSSRAPDA